MWELSKYSFVNAKVRAMLSRLFSYKELSDLAEAKDIEEILEKLKKNPQYKSLEIKGWENFELVEKDLLKVDIEIFRKVYDSISTKREKEFVFLLLQRYEIDELKVLLRLWHRNLPIDKKYLWEETLCFPLETQKILSAQSIEEIILLLEKTPYKNPLLRMKDKFKERNSLFYLEVGLDIDYYERLMNCAEGLTSFDRRIALKLLGIQIDIENINWLLRLRKFTSLELGEVLEWLIPGGEKINREVISKRYSWNNVGDFVDNIAVTPYGKIKELINENIYLIDKFLYEILLREVRRVLSGFPFTIGTVFGYLILKRAETKNIISLLYGKYYNWEKEKITPFLVC
ncbi:MAG: V-type ATPase subunit [Candidatus Omnitrophica bacterium]|nr:V-type ATPase subunit [Candidatus Omnitrophota bacterium]MCM8826337.1 V-type ATPase subunit [Candidatus Omnitrophota bacterium]